ncbi:MAG: tRNA-dihydrouridine synthase family protein [Bacteroides sp.]|nr:tRNA-dihydrouridine synthase family protein [Bacteroides sp.]
MDNSSDNGIILACGPMQGFTEVAFRHFHSKIYEMESRPLTYFTPFVRRERGMTRPRDLRELKSPLNKNHRLIPQIIFRDKTEFISLVNDIKDCGYDSVDLNLGCPFVPQVRKGYGSALLAKPELLKELSAIMHEMTDIKFSIKMRLGVEQPDEWRSVCEIINSMPLTHVTAHPRTASQQYSGELHLDAMTEVIESLRHPLIFNGDIHTPEDIDAVLNRFPSLAGIMAARGLMMRPSLMTEWSEGAEWTADERRMKILELHDEIFAYHSETLTGGDAQILLKTKPLWEYFGMEFDRKAVKKVLKAGSMANYRTAVSNLI